MHAHEFRRHDGGGFGRVVHHDGRDERHALGHQVRALGSEFPFEAEVALAALLRVCGNNRDEERAVLDLAADFLVPHIAAAEFVHVEPHFEAVAAERVGHAPRRVEVFARVAEENRVGGGSGHGGGRCGIPPGRIARIYYGVEADTRADFAGLTSSRLLCWR